MASTSLLDQPQPSETEPRPTANRAKAIPKLRSSFLIPIENTLRRVSRAFGDMGEIIEVTGFPVRVFCFRHPDHIAEILQHREIGSTKYPRVLPRVKRIMGSGGYILKGGEHWRERRRQVQTAFKREFLLRYTAHIPSLTQEMLDDWNQYAANNRVFKVCKDLQTLITRANFRCFFSEDLSGNDLDEIRSMTQFIDLNFLRSTPLWLPLPGNVRFVRYADRLKKRFLQLVRDRRSSRDSHEDLLSVLLELKDPHTGQPWSDQEIVGEMFSVYFGASVVSTSLAWSLCLITGSPAVQRRLAEESAEVFGRREPSCDDLSKLKYSDMVLQETFRLYPPSWGFPRYCERGCEVAGHRIPAKSLVIPMVWHAQRHPDFWADPAQFLPERFSPENKTEIHPYAYFPFGRGQRVCLGVNLAPMMMKLILSMIFRDYQVELRPFLPSDPIAEFGFEIHPKHPVPVAIFRQDNLLAAN